MYHNANSSVGTQNELDDTKIAVSLFPRHHHWCIQINEHFGILGPDSNHSIYYFELTFTQAVEWTTSILETWDTAHRMSYDMWYFSSKEEAKKFITLFSLKCSK